MRSTMRRGPLTTCGQRWRFCAAPSRRWGRRSRRTARPIYSLTLGHIAKTQATIGARLEAIEGHPALRMTPATFGEQVERAVANASREGPIPAVVSPAAISGQVRAAIRVSMSRSNRP